MKYSLLLLVISMLLLSCKPQKAESKHSFPPRREITISPTLKLYPMGKSLYRHETMFEFPGFGTFPCNGLLLIKNGKALMVDTPPNDELTKELYTFLQDSLEATVTKLIVTHSHNDCQGGLSFLQSKSVSSISLDKTKEIALSKSLPIASTTFSDSLYFSFEGEKILCDYFGGGHTIDNITVYVPSEKVLFGGCLIKAQNATQIGFIKEADIDAWDKTILKLKKHYTDIETVIPGHGKQGTTTLLDHTISLVQEFKLLATPNE